MGARAQGLFQVRMTNKDLKASVSIRSPSSSYELSLLWHRMTGVSSVCGGHGERVWVHSGAGPRARKDTVMEERSSEREGGRWGVRTDSDHGTVGTYNLQKSQESWVAHPLRLQDVSTGSDPGYVPVIESALR